MWRFVSLVAGEPLRPLKASCERQQAARNGAVARSPDRTTDLMQGPNGARSLSGPASRSDDDARPPPSLLVAIHNSASRR